MESSIDGGTARIDAATHYRRLLAELASFRTLGELYLSSFYKHHGQTLESVLQNIKQMEIPDARPTTSDFVRIVQWNILRGSKLNAITRAFQQHSLLKPADIVTLNEVDVGMARTGNVNVAFELGQQLKMHSVFAAEYIELTKGSRKEADVLGENNESLHGNAVLSRYPVKNVHVLRLPSCFNSFECAEKRYGDRIALFVELVCRRPLLVVSTHLEVWHTPKCRMRQMQFILQEVERLVHNTEPVIIAGDLNTLTFSRRGRLDAAIGLLKLLLANPQSMRMRLRQPESDEPLFKFLYRQGFKIRGFNDDLPTCTSAFESIEEIEYLPLRLRRFVENALRGYDNKLEFRLDYICCRGLEAAQPGMICRTSGVAATAATTILGLVDDLGEPLSDHNPILADVVV
ncbi:MAG: endonuclease/exonuclease/phosphatase family protein [Acidobacteriota bacterium]|nr:endonuclease/exonuclease/phosphatase family protein [Blastocatellia bacterium]MDW8413494.1 endonuclease/exonuclease/phosphatase family protein [Acidobacteriota bacterium]